MTSLSYLASNQKKMNKTENSSVNIGSHDPGDDDAQMTDDTQKIAPRIFVGYICMTAEERAAHDGQVVLDIPSCIDIHFSVL